VFSLTQDIFVPKGKDTSFLKVWKYILNNPV